MRTYVISVCVTRVYVNFSGSLKSVMATLYMCMNCGRCLFDYIDVFTIDVDHMKHLEDRLCGSVLPAPIIAVHQRLELVFKSDYAGAHKGFLGTYQFIDERKLAIRSFTVHGLSVLLSVHLAICPAVRPYIWLSVLLSVRTSG